LSDRGVGRLTRIREIVAVWESATEQRLGADVAEVLLNAADAVTRKLGD
jgi:hypothetical protein